MRAMKAWLDGDDSEDEESPYLPIETQQPARLVASTGRVRRTGKSLATQPPRLSLLIPSDAGARHQISSGNTATLTSGVSARPQGFESFPPLDAPSSPVSEEKLRYVVPRAEFASPKGAVAKLRRIFESSPSTRSPSPKNSFVS